MKGCRGIFSHFHYCFNNNQGIMLNESDSFADLRLDSFSFNNNQGIMLNERGIKTSLAISLL